MRTVKKEAILVDSLFTVYDRVDKLEIEIPAQYVDGMTKPEFDSSRYIVLSEAEQGRTNCIFEMSPEVFFKNASHKIKE